MEQRATPILIFVFRKYEQLAHFLERRQAEGETVYYLDPLHPQEIYDELSKTDHQAVINSGEGETFVTCHEFVLNFFGHLVAAKKVNPTKIAIMLFADRSARYCTYDPEGFLTNWPYGFFDPNWNLGD